MPPATNNDNGEGGVGGGADQWLDHPYNSIKIISQITTSEWVLEIGMDKYYWI